MNTDKIATALNTIAVAFGELAEAMTESSGPVRPDAGREVASPATPAPIEQSPFLPDEFQPSLADESVDFAPQGSEVVCPKHRRPYKDGRYGLFCTSKTDDPAWSNKNGFCTITPKNAAQYLRITAAA